MNKNFYEKEKKKLYKTDSSEAGAIFSGEGE